MDIFQAPPKTVVPIQIKRVLDGPFRHWGLKKIQGDTSTQYATPPRTYYSSPGEPSSHSRASTSQVPSFDDDWQSFRKEFQREQQKNKVEREKGREDRKKNKKFRKAVMGFLHSIAGCFSPPPENLPTYDSSSDKTTSEDAEQPSVIRRPGKAPIIPSTSSDEDVAGSEEEAIDEEATETDAAAETSGEENAEGEEADAPDEEDDDDADDDADYSAGDDEDH